MKPIESLMRRTDVADERCLGQLELEHRGRQLRLAQQRCDVFAQARISQRPLGRD